MDVIVRSNNNPVNDMTAPVSWLINDKSMTRPSHAHMYSDPRKSSIVAN